MLARSASRAVCASPGPAAVSGAGSASVARLRPFFAMLPASVDAKTAKQADPKRVAQLVRPHLPAARCRPASSTTVGKAAGCFVCS